MADQPTTLLEISQIEFLRERLERVLHVLLTEPDHTVIWIGAGLSAKYGSFPTWQSFLLRTLASHVENDEEIQLAERLINVGKFSLAAEYLHDVLGKKFPEVLSDTFGATTGQMPDQLGYLSVRDVITTNYDMLLETLLPWYNSVLPSDGLEALLSDEFKIVKIHGSVTKPSSCVVSVSNYASAYNSNLYWYLVNVFSRNSVIFIGSSMSNAEPYFRTLRFLKENSRLDRPHFALLAVQNSDQGKAEGKRLRSLGIEVIPFIPNSTYSFLDEFFQKIEASRGDTQAVQARLGLVRRNLQSGRFFHSAAILWHTCHAHIVNAGIRRDLGDAVSQFFQVTGHDVLLACNKHFDLGQLWLRASELIVPSAKSVQGLASSLSKLEASTRKKYPQLSGKLRELQSGLPAVLKPGSRNL